MIVLDASVLIAHLDSSDRHHERATGLLEGQALRHLGVSELPLAQDAAVRLAETRAQVGLKMPDCCVLLVAEEHEAIVMSFDAGLLSAAREVGLEVLD